MKKLFLLATMFVAALTFTACSSDDDEQSPSVTPTTDVKAKYTIMLYGCGGANLDECMELNLQEAMLAVNDTVQMMAKIKFSKDYTSSVYDVMEGGKTYEFKLDPEQDYSDLSKAEVAGADFKLYDPQNLADFIATCKETCPAENYILVLWNHGGGFTLSDDKPKSRAILYDDNIESSCMSLSEQVEALKLANTHFKAIYYDACLMNTIENLTALAPYADYAIASSHLVDGRGGMYSSLIDLLTEHDDFEEAMEDYCKETMNVWDASGEGRADICVTRLWKMADVNSALKTFVDRMLEQYSDSTMESAVCSCYQFDNGSSLYDLGDFVKLVTGNTFDAKLINYGSKFFRAMTRAIACREMSLIVKSEARELGWSINIGANGALRNDILDSYEADANFLGSTYYYWDGTTANFDAYGNATDTGTWGSTGELTYEVTDFDKATGWSRFIKANKIEPWGNPPYKTTRLTQEDEETEE